MPRNAFEANTRPRALPETVKVTPYKLRSLK